MGSFRRNNGVNIAQNKCICDISLKREFPLSLVLNLNTSVYQIKQKEND